MEDYFGFKKNITRKGFYSPLNNPINPFFVPKQQDKNLTWGSAKRRYPTLTPYGDYDGDGVPNYKDCHPMDPTRHGVLSAIAGAVGGVFSKKKGAVSQGWKQGMAKEGVVRSIQRKRFERKLQQQNLRRQGLEDIQRKIMRKPTMKEYIEPIKKSRPYRLSKQFTKDVARVSGATKLYQESMAPGQQAPLPIRRAVAALTGAKYLVSKKEIVGDGGTGKKGRPRGAYAGKYEAYGGVYGYRKYIASLKKAKRIAQTQNAMAMRLQEAQSAQQQGQLIQQIPQMQEQMLQGYQRPMQRQMPQKSPLLRLLTGTPPIQQPNQQFQQPNQQYPNQYTQQQRRPVVTPFKGSGNSPYPPVDNQPLQNNRDAEYYEATDAFNGRKYLKKRPTPEAWIR